MSLNLKNPRAHELAAELAKITGESLTDAVITSLEQRLSREKQKASGQTTAERILAFCDRLAALSPTTLKSEDHALMYDENGLPI